MMRVKRKSHQYSPTSDMAPHSQAKHYLCLQMNYSFIKQEPYSYKLVSISKSSDSIRAAAQDVGDISIK